MIKKLLSALLLITSVGVMNSSAQALCTSDITCVPTDSTFGICPDSATGLPVGMVGVAYTVTMSIKIPASTTVAGSTYNLSHLALTDVLIDTAGNGTYISLSNIGLSYLSSGTNTPNGASGISGYTMTTFSYWDAPGQSCVIVSGTPTVAGTFPIRIKSQARAVVFGTAVWSPAPDNDDYRLVVSPATGIAVLNNSKFDVSQNIPNPFSDKSEIRFSSVDNSNVEFKVYNLLGSVIYNSNFKSVKGINTISLDATTFAPGVYMFSVKSGANTITKRMVVSSK